MKIFEELILEVINFNVQDVIATSAFEVGDELLEEDLDGIWDALGGN